MRRGVVCGARSGVEEIVGTAGFVRGVAMASTDCAGVAVSEGGGLGEGGGCRGRAEGEANTAGVDTAVAVARAVGAAVGDAALGVARAVGAGVGDAGLGVALATEAGVGDVDTDGVGVETAAGVACAVGAVVGVAETVFVGLAIGLALTGATVVVAVVPEVLAGAGFTNVFEGASGGGVTSAFIFARARSAAGRSVSAAQLFSTVV